MNRPPDKSVKTTFFTVKFFWFVGVIAILLILFGYAYSDNLLDKWIPKFSSKNHHFMALGDMEDENIISNDPTGAMKIEALQHELAETNHHLQEYKTNLFSLNHPKDQEKINELEHRLILKEKQNLELMSMLKHIERELAQKNTKLSHTETITEALAAMIKSKNNIHEQASRGLQEQTETLLKDNICFTCLVDGYDTLYREAHHIPSPADQRLMTELTLQNSFNDLLNLFEPRPVAHYLHDFTVYDDLLSIYDDNLQAQDEMLNSLNQYEATRIQDAYVIDQLQTEFLNEISLNDAFITLNCDEMQQSSSQSETTALITFMEEQLAEKDQKMAREAVIAEKLYQQALQQHNEEIDYLTFELSLANQKYQNEQDTSLNLTQQIAKLSQVIQENGKVHADNKQMKSELDQLTQAIIESEYLHTAHALLKSKMESDFAQIAQENEKLQSTNDQLEKQIQDLSYILKDNTEALAFNEQLQSQADQLALVFNENRQLQTSNLLLLNEIQSLVQISEKSDQILEENNQLEKQISQLASYIREQDQNAEFNINLQTQIDQLILAINESDQLQVENASLLNEIDLLQTQSEQLAWMYQQQEHSNDLGQIEIEQLIQAVNKNEELEIQNGHLQKQSEQLALSQMQVESLIQAVDKNEQLELQNERLQKQSEQLALSRMQVESLIQAVDKNEQLELQNERLQKQTEQLALMIQENDEQNDQLQLANASLLHEVDYLAQTAEDNAQLKATNDRLQKQSDQLVLMLQENDQNAALNNQWVIQVEQLTEAVNKNDQLQLTQLSLLKEKEHLAQLIQENEQLHTTNNNLKKQIEQLGKPNENFYAFSEDPFIEQYPITKNIPLLSDDKIAKNELVSSAHTIIKNEPLRFAKEITEQIESPSLDLTSRSVNESIAQQNSDLNEIYLAFLEQLSQVQETQKIPKPNSTQLRKSLSPTSRFTRIAQFKNENRKSVANLNEKTSTSPSGRTHQVLEGESLQDLANIYYSSPENWEIIYEANRDKIQDIHHLNPGILLVIPEMQH